MAMRHRDAADRGRAVPPRVGAHRGRPPMLANWLAAVRPARGAGARAGAGRRGRGPPPGGLRDRLTPRPAAAGRRSAGDAAPARRRCRRRPPPVPPPVPVRSASGSGVGRRPGPARLGDHRDRDRGALLGVAARPFGFWPITVPGVPSPARPGSTTFDVEAGRRRAAPRPRPRVWPTTFGHLGQVALRDADRDRGARRRPAGRPCRPRRPGPPAASLSTSSNSASSPSSRRRSLGRARLVAADQVAGTVDRARAAAQTG